MQIVTKAVEHTLDVKRSKFITHIVAFHDFESTLSALRNAHPKARHIVTAFRHFNEFEQVVEGCSDDGEPKSTAGKPTLSVLQGHELINCALLTVRYFGGIKLGTGGLVRAYSDAANAAIAQATLKQYEQRTALNFLSAFESERKVYYHCSVLDIDVIHKQYSESGVQWFLEVTAMQKEQLLLALGDIML